MRNVFIIISSSIIISIIVIIIIIISHLTCALCQQEKPGLKREYEGTKKHNTESNEIYPSLSLLTEALLCLSLVGFCYLLPTPNQKRMYKLIPCKSKGKVIPLQARCGPEGG